MSDPTESPATDAAESHDVASSAPPSTLDGSTPPSASPPGTGEPAATAVEDSAVARVRREAARYRNHRNEARAALDAITLTLADDADPAEVVAAIRGSLPGAPVEDTPNPEIVRLTAENDRLRLRLTVDSAARTAGADPDLVWGWLLASETEITAETDVAALVAAAVKAKPALAAAGSVASQPPRSGADIGGAEPPAPDPSGMPMDAYMAWRKNRPAEAPS